MRQTAKRDRHSEIVEQRARKSATYRKTFERTLHQIDLALLVREMREDAGLTQAELARKVGTTQSVIARLEDAEYAGHSLTMLERIAAACGVALKLHAKKKAKFRPRSCTGIVAGRTAGMPMKPEKKRKRPDHSGSTATELSMIPAAVNHAENTIRAFVLQDKQERFLGFLANPKNRKKFTGLLAHFRWFDRRFATPIPWKVDPKFNLWERHVQGIENIQRLLQTRGAGQTCWVISEDSAIDGQELNLSAALEHVSGNQVGAILSCVPGCCVH